MKWNPEYQRRPDQKTHIGFSVTFGTSGLKNRSSIPICQQTCYGSNRMIKKEESTIQSERAEIVFDLAAFGMTAIFAYVEQWTATDLAWGLWSSSLFVGYVSLLVTIGRSIRFNHVFSFIGTVIYAVYLTAFFTVHFGGFHLGHALFLNSFLPLIPGMGSQISEGVIETLLMTTFSHYWVLVFGSFLRALPAMRPSGEVSQGEMLFRPYLNVLRMHLFIFILVILKNQQLEHWSLVTLLFLYFFPWRTVLLLLRKHHS